MATIDLQYAPAVEASRPYAAGNSLEPLAEDFFTESTFVWATFRN